MTKTSILERTGSRDRFKHSCWLAVTTFRAPDQLALS
jgi:hypothetical protein